MYLIYSSISTGLIYLEGGRIYIDQIKDDVPYISKSKRGETLGRASKTANRLKFILLVARLHGLYYMRKLTRTFI